MKKFPVHAGLRAKLLLSNIIIIIILGASTIAFIKTVFKDRLLEQFRRRGIYITKDVAKEATSFILTGNNILLQILINDHKESIEDIEYVYILDRKGEILVHTFDEGFPLDLKKVNIPGKNEEFKIKAISIRKEHIYDVAVPVLKGQAGVVHIGFSEALILAETTHVVELIAGIISVILILAIILTVMFSAHIINPILSLIKAVRLMSAGKFTGKVEVAGSDEIGELSGAFNQMTEDLNKSHNELVEWSRTLEIKVEERTRDLEQAYLKLEELQDSLIQAEKFNAIGRLASGVAHEIKNPLGIIKQSAEFLKNKLSVSDKNAPEALKMIQDNILRADSIIHVLLDFSRSSKLEKKPENINSILEASLTLIQYNPMLENVKIFRELGANLPDVRVDRGKIEQVFINILLNAVQAMPKGGSLFLRTYQSKVSRLEEGMNISTEKNFKLGDDVLIIEIEDTGEGISQEDMKKVFDPFFTTKGPGQGTGLGLSVSKNILAMHRGFIQIQSRKGEGTKVLITLKIEQALNCKQK